MKHIIDDETIEAVGILAQLDLTGNEREQARTDMARMLDYVDKLNELDTEDVEPMSHVFRQTNVFREDIVINGDCHEEMLANAPLVKNGCYVAPKSIG